MTVDGFNKKMDRIYIETMETSNNPGKIRMCFDVTFSALSGHSGTEKQSVFISVDNQEITRDNQSYNVNMLITDSVFLQILDYPMVAGANNIRHPEDVLITEAFAAKIFGKENPIGETLFSSTINRSVTIAGIIRTPANKSALSFDMLASLQLRDRWSGYVQESLILLYTGTDYRNINRQNNEFKEDALWKYGFRHQLFPYRDVYLDKHINDFDIFAHGNITYIFILSSIGVLLLLIGLVNYINIHYVVMIRRNKELSMKKIFGAGGLRIFIQLSFENLLLIAVSLVVAFWLATVLHPFVENTFGVRQYPNLQFDVLLVLALVLILPVAVSIAPYLRYRYSTPIRSLRSVNSGNKSMFSRNFFIVFQYFMTMGLISVSLFFVKQLNFMMNKDLGFRTQNIISVPFNKSSFAKIDQGKQVTLEKTNAIAAQLEHKMNESPLIEYWCYGNFPFVNREQEYRTSDGELQTVTNIEADEQWLKMFDIKLLNGELWHNESSCQVIVSESALKQFGFTNHRDAELYSSVQFIGTTKGTISNPPYQIVGVTKDFYTAHLSKQLAPVVIHLNKRYINDTDPVIASFAPGRRQEIIAFMKNLHDDAVGGEFTYSFIEDEIAKLYGDDKKVASICVIFTGIAIVVSMLGLFGLSLFDIRQRRKEIAIRKINGAQIIDIVRLLLKKYFVLLGIAFVVATPVALFVIHKYLENFANKTSISWWLFAVALVVTFAVSLFTLLYQTYKAGSENPVEVIKSEI
jgi:ABC-type antimicrobial peptide transport system permease subunit